MSLSLRSTIVEVNLNNYAHNIKEIKNIIGNKIKLMLVVKGDASGLGAVELAKAAERLDVDYFAVAFVDEAIKLRQNNINRPILVFGVLSERELKEAVKYDLSVTLSCLKNAKMLSKFAEDKKKKAKAHIKVDTGMNRLGVKPESSLKFVKRVKALSGIYLEGMYTHFAKAHIADKRFTEKQLNRLIKVKNRLKKNKINIPFYHAANSGATYKYPNTHLDMVRCAALALNLSPSDKIELNERFKPIFSFKTQVIFKKNVPTGQGISYEHSFITKRNSVIATLPTGYGDGYPGQLSNKGKVLIKGKFAPIVGKICMDQMMIDVTDIPNVDIGNEVVLIGQQGNNIIKPSDLGNLAGIMHAELICGINKRVPRVYKGKL